VCLTLEHLEDRYVPSSGSYVASLYTLLLHRNPDPSEVSHWVSLMHAGASPRFVASSFLTSAEYRTGVVTGTYENLLHREPDAPSLPGRVASLAGGVSPEQLTADVLASEEYFGLHGRSDDSWLQAVYTDVLGRDVDVSGEIYWEVALQSGTSRFTVALDI